MLLCAVPLAHPDDVFGSGWDMGYGTRFRLVGFTNPCVQTLLLPWWELFTQHASQDLGAGAGGLAWLQVSWFFAVVLHLVGPAPASTMGLSG